MLRCPCHGDPCKPWCSYCPIGCINNIRYLIVKGRLSLGCNDKALFLSLNKLRTIAQLF